MDFAMTFDERHYVYKITCLSTKAVYVGRTSKIFQRFSSHKAELLAGRHINKRLQDDFSKHGADSFLFEVVATVSSSNEGKKREAEVILQHAREGVVYNSVLPKGCKAFLAAFVSGGEGI